MGDAADDALDRAIDEWGNDYPLEDVGRELDARLRAPTDLGEWFGPKGNDGPILIRDMEDRHLTNAIAWIERHEDAIRDMILNSFGSNFQGEMATYYAEQEEEKMRDTGLWCQETLRLMQMEQKLRKPTRRRSSWGQV